MCNYFMLRFYIFSIAGRENSFQKSVVLFINFLYYAYNLRIELITSMEHDFFNCVLMLMPGL